MFDNATVAAVAAIAARLKVEPAALLAVAEVESGGKAFATVSGRKEPLIRFEGHYFDRRLSAEDRKVTRAKGLAAAKAGAVKNPAGQAARWTMLARAEAINRQAARESVSWGVGQVMGAHWKWLGFGSVDDLVALARRDVAGQVELMARYVEKAGLVAALRSKDWKAFARGYNGPAYAQNAYDTKIAAAYRRWAAKDSAASVEPKQSILKKGSKGPFVAELQANLAELGYIVTADGIFGVDTESAVKAFQKSRSLTVDGWAGPRTLDAIGKALAERAAKPKIEEAKKTVPPTADTAVKKEVGFFSKIAGWLGLGGVVTSGAVGSAFEADWTTILAVAVGVILIVGAAVAGFLIFGSRIAAKFDEINARARQ